MSILCLDIGSGTQDVLYYNPAVEPHNCPKFVLPSPARAVAARINSLAASDTPVYLHGFNMGGGFGGAVRKVLKAGGTISAHPAAAKSLGDNLDRVEAMGIRLSETCPAGHATVHLADFSYGFWSAFLAAAGLDMPNQVLASAQDHGEHLDCGNREGRFRLWEQFLREADGRPEALLFDTPPAELTRLISLQAQTGGQPVADTGAAAVLGALSMEDVTAESREHGICMVNLGNSHTIAYLIYDGRIYGIYEHHTGLLNGNKLMEQLTLFRTGKLEGSTVYDDMGHGSLTLDLPAAAQGFPTVHVIGPQRNMLAGRGLRFLSPYGDMMLAGCWGLVHGLKLRDN